MKQLQTSAVADTRRKTKSQISSDFLSLIRVHTFLCLMTLVFLGVKAHAVPTLYPDTVNTSVRNTTTSSILQDSVDSRLFYVLPPQNVVAQATGLQAATANIGFCREIAQIQTYSLKTAKMIDETIGQMSDLKNESVAQRADIQKKMAELSLYTSANNLIDLSLLDQNLDKQQQRLADLYEKSKSCKIECDSILKDIQSTLALSQELIRRRTDIIVIHVNEAREYEKRKSYLESLNQQYDLNMKRLSDFNKLILSLKQDFDGMYSAHSQREGAQAQFDYNSGWTQNVSMLQMTNPSYRFQKITTRNAMIRADGYQKLASLPQGSVLSFSFSGMDAKGTIALPSYPESLSGLVTLNLLAVCPMLYPESFGLDRSHPSVDPSKMKYGLTVTFDYPVEAKYDLEIQYNMYKMYWSFQAAGADNSFFNPSTWSISKEETLFNDSFKTTWFTNSEQALMTSDQKKSIESDLRRQMLTRLAQQLAMKSSRNLNDTFEVPLSGAVVLSNGLAAKCSFSYICQGASLGFSVLASIFGSSQASQEYLQTINVTQTERWADHQIVMQSMLTSYR